MFYLDIYFEISKWIFKPKDIKAFGQTCKSFNDIVKLKLYKAKTLQGIRKEYFSSPYDSILKRHIVWFNKYVISRGNFFRLTTKEIGVLGRGEVSKDKYILDRLFIRQIKCYTLYKQPKFHDYLKLLYKKPKLYAYLKSIVKL